MGKMNLIQVGLVKPDTSKSQKFDSENPLR
jgi:hypothetical protein